MPESQKTISVDEFISRLAAVCLNPSGMGMPRRTRDRDIVLMSLVLTLEEERDYSELELNRAINGWRARVGQKMALDHVTLRRHLVDEGYVVRDAAGAAYRVSLETAGSAFDHKVLNCDPERIIDQAIMERLERKRRHLLRNRGDS